MSMRNLLIALAAILLIAMLVPMAFADTNSLISEVPVNKAPALTQDKLEQIKPTLDKVLEAKKELLKKYVDMGVITQDEADSRIQWIEQNQANRLQNGFMPGLGKGGFRGGCGGGGCGGGGCNYAAPSI